MTKAECRNKPETRMPKSIANEWSRASALVILASSLIRHSDFAIRA